jgi:hypothetical protein
LLEENTRRAAEKSGEWLREAELQAEIFIALDSDKDN